MPSFRELLSATKAEIREVDTAEADEIRRRPGAVVLDVREPDEYEQGAIPGAVHIARGTLEGSVEGRLTDKAAPIVIHCASGVRSAFAAKTLTELGYEDVVSMSGGFNKWKDEGRDWKAPQVLSADQRNRYQRHLLLPEVGIEGQQKLLGAKVLLLGAGGLGSPAAMYLTAAGVGTIGIVDMDVVDESNLQRQILHNMDRIGERKVDSAKKTLTALNPDVDVVTHDVRLGADNVMEILSGYDVVVDGADNFPVRYLLNDAALKLGVKVVHGSIFRFEGQITVFKPHDGPCYRCFLPEPPPPELAPSCAEAGVLGVLPGIVGSIQALEAIKLILDLGDDLSGRLLAYDSLEQSFRTYKILRDPQCPTCSIDPADIVIAEYDEHCAPHRAHAH
ncbi:MAG TPA: molybdopterin-synthase adenylyltransferase MoeB [Acidimicrobiales bacterium]|nr:molybdopterin-synthase adenylyltransferase MoeB [Acidimicrobiales bacterium]